MENTNSPKKKFRIPKLPKWARIAAVLVVAIMGIAAVVAIVNSASKSPAEKLFDRYVSAVKSQNATKYAGLFYNKGTEEYKDLLNNYSKGKSEYKKFVSNNAKTSQNYIQFWDLSSPDANRPEEYGLHLWSEQQLAKGIKGYTVTVLRMDKNYCELNISFSSNSKFDGSVLPDRYKANGNSLPENVKVKACRINGKWIFGNDFSLYLGSNQSDLDTWYAPYGKDGAELKHLGFFELPKDGHFNMTGLQYQGKPVVSIGDYAFTQRAKDLKKVTLPAGLKNIGKYAFSGCEELTEIVIAGSDEDFTVNEGAFYDCKSLKAFDLPKKNEAIAPYTFYNCKALTSFTFKDTVDTIGYYAFYGCSGLTSISIPDGVTVIGNGAFEGCTALRTFNNGNKLSDKIIRLGSAVFKNCSALVSVTIPETISELDSAVFQGCGALTDLTLPDNMTKIGNNCFAGTGIVKRSIPKNVESIGKGAFAGCPALTEIEWSADTKIRTIGEGAFAGSTALYKFTLPASLKSLGAGAFTGCTGLRYVMLDCSPYIDMGENPFMMSDGIPKFYTKYTGEGYIRTAADGTDIYGDINLHKFTIAWTMLSLEIYSQNIIENDMATITENGEKTLIQYTGSAPDLTLSGITHINKGAFSHNTQLRNLTINSNEIKSIGQDVFNGCSQFNFDSYKNDYGEVLYVGNWLIYGVNYGEKELYKGNMLDLTLSSTGDNALISTAGETPVTVGIAAMAFAVRGLSVKLESVKLPATLKYIGEEAFSGTSISAVEFVHQSSVLDTIGKGAFERCEMLKGINLPASLKTIADNAFYGCRGLRYAIINSASATVGRLAFEYSFTIRKDSDIAPEVEIREFYYDTLKIYISGYTESTYYKNDPNWSIYSNFTYDYNIISGGLGVGEYAIIGNKIIQYVGGSADVGEIGTGATASCTIIGEGAFAGSAIETVVIGGNITTIEKNAFYSCEQLMQVTLKSAPSGSALIYIGNYAFGNCKTLSDPRETNAFFDMTALDDPNTDLIMGQNVFDEDVIRKIKIKVRKNFINVKPGNLNAPWAAYGDALAADDDPSVTVYMHFESGLESHDKYGNWTWINIATEQAIYRAPKDVLEITATPDTVNGYEFVGWFKGAYNGTQVYGDPKTPNKYSIVFSSAETNDKHEKYYAVYRRASAYVTALVDSAYTLGGKIAEVTGVDNQGKDITSDWTNGQRSLRTVDSTVKLKAVLFESADYDYRFVGWYHNNVQLATTEYYSLDVTDVDYTIEARFEVKAARLTVYADNNFAGGEITMDGDPITASYSQKVDVGKTMTFTATAQAGYEFTGWYAGASNSVPEETGATYTFTKGNKTEMVVAKFRKIVELTFEVKTVKIDNTDLGDVGGTVKNVNRTDYVNDAKITLEAEAKTGYKFYTWEFSFTTDGGATWSAWATDDRYTIATTQYTVPAVNTKIRAVFMPATMLTIKTTTDGEASDKGGKADPESGIQIVGFEVRLIATAAEGYEFEGWYVEGSSDALSTEARYTYTVTDDDVVIVAKFKKIIEQ